VEKMKIYKKKLYRSLLSLIIFRKHHKSTLERFFRKLGLNSVLVITLNYFELIFDFVENYWETTKFNLDTPFYRKYFND
jgi:hypothetical protein